MTFNQYPNFAERFEHLKALVENIAYPTVEKATTSVGQVLDPITRIPGVKALSKVPGLNWLLIGLGQVDIDVAQADVDRLRREYTMEDNEAIAQRVIQDTALQAGRLGLLTNLAPPIALALFAVDIVGITKLQAEMTYRLAAVYGLDLEDPSRSGEVITLYSLAFASGTPTKFALSWVELIPVIGTVVGASSNAILIYGLGQVAQKFYAAKAQQLTTGIENVVA